MPKASRNLTMHERICGSVSLALFVFILVSAIPSSSYAAYINRYSVTTTGGMTYTGNALGLSHRAGYTDDNRPGTAGSIGTFSTTNSSTRENSYWPYGTTGTWTSNSASAVLRIPSGSTILYAELIWGGSYNYGGENVTASLNNSVTFITPSGTSSVSPDSATAKVSGSSTYFYVRSADVTSRVRTAGAGTYTVGGVPGTQGTNEDNSNTAGWTLAVIYENATLPKRNMTIFVGCELSNSSLNTTSSVSGFCTASSGTINARMMVSAIEGDSNISGDQMQFGPTVATLAAVSGPNNPISNFFCSQNNKDDGALDTAGTHGGLNHTPGSNGSGMRQGWDITNIDVSSRMQPLQTTAYARGISNQDQYTISSIGLQINVGVPQFPFIVLGVDKATTYVGDELTYTTDVNNTAGTADAINCIYTDPLPAGTSFVAGSFKIDGVTQPAANPVTGVDIGTIAQGTRKTVSYKVLVTAIPAPPAVAEYRVTATWNYEYLSCPGLPNYVGSVTTNTVVTGTVRFVSVKTSVPSGSVRVTENLIYTISIGNTGTTNPSAATVTGVPPSGSITNEATIDTDGGGPAPSGGASCTNPVSGPVITLTKAVDKTSAEPGSEIIYSVYYKNSGNGAATNLIILDSVPLYTSYVTGSLREGNAASTYATANPLTDAPGETPPGNVDGQVSGLTISFIINSVSADNGVPNSGSDEGKVYFKVTVQ
ncbi:MAG: DUF11 domain-containing protein [Deltaproteobacteria bacterium]|nr:DUF11 domain-containing protein [Deltaproteobacteria bacterium]